MVQPAVLLGLDLGASKVVSVIAVLDESGALQITGAAQANAEGGIRMGEINDMELTTRAINRAVEESMRAAGQAKLEGLRVSVDGIQFKGENLRDSITISSMDKIITVADRDRVLEQAANGCKLAKEETVLHRIPQMFHIRAGHPQPVNMVGETLEAEVRIIVAPGSVLGNINRALLSGLQGADLLLRPWHRPKQC